MHTFKYFALSLSLCCALSAKIDPNNLSTESQLVQEQVAYALIKRDFDAIKAALEAGANPYTVHESVKDPVGTSPYALLTYKSRGVFEQGVPAERMIAEMDAFYESVAFLMQLNISVYEGSYPGAYFGGSFGYKWRDIEPENIRFGENLPDGVNKYGYELVRRIQTLIKAQQPYAPYELHTAALSEASVSLDTDTSLPLESVFDNLSTEMPVNPQEKLVWAIAHLNPEIVSEALAEGADPFACHWYIEKSLSKKQKLVGSPYTLVVYAFSKQCENIQISNATPFTSEVDLFLNDALARTYRIFEIMLERNIPLLRGVTPFIFGSRLYPVCAASLALDGLYNKLPKELKKPTRHSPPAWVIELIQQWGPKFVALAEKHQPKFVALARSFACLAKYGDDNLNQSYDQKYFEN